MTTLFRKLPLQFFALSLILFTSMSFSSAQQSEKEIQPTSYKVAGRGIQDDTTKEIILMVCVGESVMNNELDCGVLRLLQLKPGIDPVWLGNSFHAGDIVQMREELSKWYSEKSLEGMFSFLKGDTTYAFSDSDGWNWSNNPLQLATNKFSKVVSTVLYFAEYKRSLENERKRKVSARDVMEAEQGVQGYRGVYLSSVKERNSRRSIIYSVTDTEVVISLFSRGVVKELKALKIDKTNETLELEGHPYSLHLFHSLSDASGSAYHWCFDEDSAGKTYSALFYKMRGREGSYNIYDRGYIPPAFSGMKVLLVGALVTIPLCAILPSAPFLAGVTLLPVESVVEFSKSIFHKDARAKRKFAKFMREKDLKMGHRVFESMIEQVKAL